MPNKKETTPSNELTTTINTLIEKITILAETNRIHSNPKTKYPK